MSGSQGHDATIQGTDTDAAVSRLSAVEVGYLEDTYAQYFVQNSAGPASRRLPIINRGTYTRTTALDRLVAAFLSSGDASQEKQIVSLGAGTDTRCFRLFSQPTSRKLIYHEVDFPAISSRKYHIVQATPVLGRVLTQPTREGETSWRSAPAENCQYWCHGLDLRQLARDDEETFLAGLRTDVPTLLVSECCLCYLETTQARKVIKWFTDKIPDIGIVLYEPTKPEDPFGKMMVSNLAARRIRMPTLEVYKEPQDQETRLRDAGFEQVRQLSVDHIWETWVSEVEKERVDGLEGLDEVEEWKLLAGHYIVAWGWRGTGFDGWLS